MSGDAMTAFLAEAEAHLAAGRAVEALRASEKALAAGPARPGLHALSMRCLLAVGRHEEALDAARAELALDPDQAEARQWAERLAASLTPEAPPVLPSRERSYHTALPRQTLLSIQKAGHRYAYRGVPMIKNPFDLALYPLLLWREKPRTIVEIGSKRGGSALWMGDMLDNFGIDGRILSIDVVRVADVSHPRVDFLEGDGRNLGPTLPADLLAGLARPLLVIEDADHTFETSWAVLEFFRPHVRSGEYVVVEDGIISDLEGDPACGSGPHRAIRRFLGENPDWEIDGSYCDFFGYNLTWCTNGFLRKS